MQILDVNQWDYFIVLVSPRNKKSDRHNMMIALVI